MASDRQLNLYRRCTPVVDTRYDERDTETILEVLAESLADAAGVDVTELPPLYETIDVEAVSQLLDSNRSGNADTIVSFTVDHWNVFVRSDGRIRICDGTQPTDPTPVFETAGD